MPQVSIITPTYNCARFIEETIKSVQAQTFTDWEMIISDDCSTDNTQEVIAPYLASDSRIKYICNDKNSGAAITRNNALRIASGRWIAFLDSDDLWLPKKLEKQISFMIENGINFSYTNYSEIDENGNPLGIVVTGPRKISKFGMYAYCWPGCLTVMYDSQYVGLIQIDDIKKNNDYALWLKVIKRADCYLLKDNLAKYRRRAGSISNHSYSSLIKWHYRLFKENDKQNPFVSTILTLGNIVFGICKKFIYVKNNK
ncbi:MAG: glycosyltransferase family 2 protein [Alistipes sp.]|nr:glycosyltransferase family 2 protein [Alistipes sp.]